ncbi:benzoate/H(+) symporter BenE family transporter [Enterobacter hormaechei]|uniref:benzoate/H(+) symporter BenE family transporter n=1 Tax=Enterobacter hormaechei TaxID=158836 RepID=UPI000643DCC9|nr:benzoate/H(+) symporter BenE family transporter [Enterobacter hormaechei]KLR13036.1 benzoate transporter [Enterobacter hormaechei subsp. hormaechei]MBN4761723.1 benzoate/H(+) symporter BenE family transporter [Enterobacter hormaechei]MBN4796160.1 benzoate/H(+) symporter BenE family transporter [Enterobacter hormaechei]MBN4820429.1 benzoate/H(+) symporter BenE family transporter [Enterobacter hormaechei]MCO7369447.1 benzoate/H(+) symporter BenE family transporter [Enterobacter hormaechei]
MRSTTSLFPAVLAGFVAVLVGYASSAAIIWQAAAAAGASSQQIAGWMTALGLGMGISTLALSWWYKAPVLTAWSTPGAALLATSLQGVTLAETIGVFIFANALILLCGVTGLFARLMKLIPHSLAAAMLAGVLLQFGLKAFSNLEGQGVLCGSMLAAWLVAKAVAPRYAIVATLLTGVLVAWAGGDVVTDKMTLSVVMPEFIAPAFTFTSLISIGLPFFLVTMASQNAPGFATMQASGYPLPISPLIVATGGLALLLSPFGVYSVCIAAITAAICQSPDAHPDASKRWLAAVAAGGFYLLAGVFGGSISGLMAALPLSGIQTLAGLALLGTISGSLYQALNHEAERDAAIVTFLMTASGVTILGIGSAFWGLVLGGICYAVLSRLRRA